MPPPADTAADSSSSKKRKRPPSFVHLPANRAKKLKQDWVQNKKIKAQWRAEKKKLAVEPQGPDDEGEEEEWGGIQESDASGSRSPSPTPPPPPAKNAADKGKSKAKEDDAEKTAPSLRDLGREAYSRDSLHTFKADPLGRRRGHAGGPPRGQGRARGRGRGRGGGQPDMRLRMNHLVESIKARMQ